MKISLVTDLDCRHRFIGSDGKTFAFPGQDFKPLGGPTNEKKCRGIYVGPDIIDKLKCEPDPPEDFSYSDTSSGVSEPSPSSPVSIPCFCDIRAAQIGFNGFGGILVEVVNFGTCDVIFDVVYASNMAVSPDTNVPLPASGRVVLDVDLIVVGSGYQPITIVTDKCGSFSLYFGTIYPTAVP